MAAYDDDTQPLQPDVHAAVDRAQSNGMLLCWCGHCRHVFFTETTLGPLVCPHCTEGTWLQRWGRVSVTFHEEH